MDEPLNDADVQQLLRVIIETGTVVFTNHARQRMRQRGLDEVDVLNVLRAGYCSGADLVRQSWRYQIHTRKLCVVVAFRSEHKAVVVTAWRKS